MKFLSALIRHSRQPARLPEATPFLGVQAETPIRPAIAPASSQPADIPAGLSAMPEVESAEALRNPQAPLGMEVESPSSSITPTGVAPDEPIRAERSTQRLVPTAAAIQTIPGPADPGDRPVESPLAFTTADPASPESQIEREPARWKAPSEIAATPDDSVVVEPAASAAPVLSQRSVPVTSVPTAPVGLPERTMAKANTPPSFRESPLATREPVAKEDQIPGNLPEQGATVPAALADPKPWEQAVRQSHSQEMPKPPEAPQVRIGQINVLVEDQSKAKAGARQAGPKAKSANPFGLRGL